MRIIRQMDLWERGLHTGLVGDADVEGADREGRAASGGEKDYKAIARRYQDTVLAVKLRQDVSWATNSKGKGCLLLDDQCTKNERQVADVLW